MHKGRDISVGLLRKISSVAVYSTLDYKKNNISGIIESLLLNNSTFVKFADWALNSDPDA